MFINENDEVIGEVIGEYRDISEADVNENRYKDILRAFKISTTIGTALTVAGVVGNYAVYRNRPVYEISHDTILLDKNDAVKNEIFKEAEQVESSTPVFTETPILQKNDIISPGKIFIPRDILVGGSFAILAVIIGFYLAK